MTHYETAYVNSDIPEITARQANLWCIDPNNFCISPSTKFFCSENCTLELTCAHLNTDFFLPQNQRKMSPYFVNRKKGIHSPNCSREAKRTKEASNIHLQTEYYEQIGNTFILEFEKGKGFIPKALSPTTVSRSENSLFQDGTRTVTKKSQNELAPQERHRRISDFKNLIEYFERYQEGATNITLLDKKKNLIHFSDVFECIPYGYHNKKKETQLSNEHKIYYGQAKCTHPEDLKGTALQLTFSGKSVIGQSNPTHIRFLLYKNDCEKNRKKTMYELLEKIANAHADNPKDKHNYFTLYFMGNFFIKQNGYIDIEFAKFYPFPQHISIKRN